MARRIDSIQGARVPPFPLDELDRIYWDELRRMMLGTTRLHGSTLTALGVLPLLRLGHPVDGARAILGGLLAAEPGGTIGFEHDGGLTRVAVRGYAPRLPRRLYALQSAVHQRLSARFFRRLRARASA